jgi:hypothetical protein
MIFNENTDEHHSNIALTVVNLGQYKIVSNYSDSIIALDGGHYYIKIYSPATGANLAYSETFSVTNDLYNLVKLEIISKDITLDGSITIPYSNLHPVFYLPYNQRTIVNAVKEEGVEKSWGDIPVFSTVSIQNKLEINGTSQIYRMLSFLRPLLVNGTVIVTLNGISSSIYDPLIEIKDEVSGKDDNMIMTFSYKEYNFISSKNAV